MKFSIIVAVSENLGIGIGGHIPWKLRGNIYPPNVILCSSFQEALQKLNRPPHSETVENVWIIGGSSVYEEALKNESCHRLYITKINKNFECDTFFPKKPEEFEEIQDDIVPKGIQEEDGITYEYKVYERRKQ